MGDADPEVAVLERPTEALEPPGAAATTRPGLPQDVPAGPDAPVMSILATTRAMRHLAPDPVPNELIRAVIEAATWAPNAGNWQTAQFVVVTDRVTMARLAVLWARVIDDYRTLMDASGMQLAGEPVQDRIRASIDYQRDHFADTPVLVIVCEDKRSVMAGTRSPMATLRVLRRQVGVRRTIRLVRAWQHGIARSRGASFYPAVQNLLIAARAHGLAACLTTWHLFAEDEFKETVGIPKDVATYAVIPIGWPLRRFGPVRRRPVDEVIHRERW